MPAADAERLQPKRATASCSSIAKEVIQWVGEQILLCPTDISLNEAEIPKRAAILKAKDSIRAESVDAKKLLESSSEFSPYHYQAALDMVEKIIKFSIGACYEKAFIGMFYIAMRYPDVNAELVALLHGDHALIVIGREPKSPRSKPLEWGDKAILCDPWSKQSYPASEYKKHLRAYCAYSHYSGRYGRYLLNKTAELGYIHHLLVHADVSAHTIRASAKVFSDKESHKKQDRKPYVPSFFYPGGKTAELLSAAPPADCSGPALS